MSTVSSNQRYSKEYIKDLVDKAANLIAPAWSLRKFVASNPLKGLEGLEFEAAAKLARKYFDACTLPDDFAVFNASRKGDFKLEDFDYSFSEKISDPELSFVFKSREINKKDFLIKSALRSNQEFEKIIESKDFKNLVKELSLENKQLIKNQKKVHLLTDTREEKFLKLVNVCLMRWLERFNDQGQASIEMPNRELGLYRAWKKLVVLKDLSSEQKNIIRALPADSSEALVELLTVLGIKEEDWEEYLRLSFLSLPGWASYMKWRIDYNPDPDFDKIAPPSLLDFLVLRLALERIFILDFKKKKDPDEFNKEQEAYISWILTGLLKYGFEKEDIFSLQSEDLKLLDSKFAEIYLRKGIIYLESIERTVNYKTKEELSEALAKPKPAKKTRPEAQMVFCIDVRSEAFRRAIEAQGAYETFGYAGFFGVPVRYHSLENNETVDSCPVLIKPRNEVFEEACMKTKGHNIVIKSKNRSFVSSLNKACKDLKVNFASIFVYSEASGIFYAFRILFKTLMPGFYSWIQKSFKKKFIPKINYHPLLECNKGDISGICVEDQFTYGKNALSMIGLTENFAPFVIFCGHGSSTVNNPYASALDCGACGGSKGGPNAKVIAKILNSKIIREMLAEKEGIQIPEDTVFLAAQHDTTDDSVEIYDLENYDPDLTKLNSDLKKAKEQNNLYRQASFTGENTPDIRSCDWSEVRPEWGLAGNSCFIIAPRWMTVDKDFGARTFLHSYEYDKDPDASNLETIMTAPMVVTQWINSQYYFSAVNNVYFGSGSKITHNVAGTVVVVQGNSSDLMHGLALQSVNSTDLESYHTPVRITNYIYAPLDRVKAILEKHENLKTLVNNSWIKIVVIDPSNGSFSDLRSI